MWDKVLGSRANEELIEINKEQKLKYFLNANDLRR